MTSLGGDSEEKGDYRWRPTLGSKQWEPQIWCHSPGVIQREDKPPWLVGGPLGLTDGSGKPGPCSCGTHERWLVPETEGREDYSTTTLEHATARDEWTLQPHSIHITVWHWIWGNHDQGEDSAMGCRVDLVQGWSLGGAVAAIVDT